MRCIVGETIVQIITGIVGKFMNLDLLESALYKGILLRFVSSNKEPLNWEILLSERKFNHHLHIE